MKNKAIVIDSILSIGSATCNLLADAGYTTWVYQRPADAMAEFIIKKTWLGRMWFNVGRKHPPCKTEDIGVVVTDLYNPEEDRMETPENYLACRLNKLHKLQDVLPNARFLIFDSLRHNVLLYGMTFAEVLDTLKPGQYFTEPPEVFRQKHEAVKAFGDDLIAKSLTNYQRIPKLIYEGGGSDALKQAIPNIE